MKAKNTNFFQQHVEKLIVGAGLLIAAVIVLLYVVGSPYAAEVNNQEMSPSDLTEQVAKQAQQLNMRLDSPESPIPERGIPPYTQDFRRRADHRVAPAQYQIAFNRPGTDPRDVNVEGPTDEWSIPRPPVPTEVVAATGVGVLGAFEDRRTADQFLQFARNQQPPDIRYVSVAGTFDLADWRKRLETSSLPSQFYRGIADFIAGTYLLRQELKPGGDPANDADWTNATVVPALPTQAGFQPSYEQQFLQEQADAALNFLKQNQERVARPAFPPLGNNGIWQPPGSRMLTAEDHERLRDLRGTMDRLTRQITQYEDRLERQAEAEARRQGRQVPQRQPRQPNFGDMGDPGDMGPTRPRPNPGAARQTRDQEQAAAYQRWVADLQAARAEYIELTGGVDPAGQQQQQGQAFDPTMIDPYGPPGMYGPEGYGPDMYGPPGQYPGEYGPPGQYPGAQPGRPDDPNAPKPGMIKVWAHDLTVEPGKTYRYKLLVAGVNPLFRQKRAPQEQVEQNFHKVALGPDKSELDQAEWTAPVRVYPEREFFMLTGSQQTATIEVWRVYNGRWVNDEFPVQPGDPIGGTTRIKTDAGEEVIDMKVDAVVVDLVEIGSGGGMGSRDSRMLYIEPGTQDILARSAARDSDSPDRIKLLNEKAIQEAQVQAVARAASR